MTTNGMSTERVAEKPKFAHYAFNRKGKTSLEEQRNRNLGTRARAVVTREAASGLHYVALL